MKRFFYSLVALLTVVGYGQALAGCNSCSGCSSCSSNVKNVQTIRIKVGRPEGQKTFTAADFRAMPSIHAREDYGYVPRAQENRRTDYQLMPEYYDSDEYDYDDLYVTETVNDGHWYLGGRLDLNLLSWNNTYSVSVIPSDVTVAVDASADHDRYRFKPVMGGNLFVGYRFNQSWRTDVEFGLISKYSDSDSGFTFGLSGSYVVVNGYYEFTNGLYLGAGLGAAFPKVSLDFAHFVPGGSTKTTATLTGALMVGYSYYLSDSVVLDLRYRLSGFDGPSLTRRFVDSDYPFETLKTDVSFVVDNAFSVGVRYEF
ncbi:MAG: outer membrane beta-barrel protein [Alphaproteobacteria bacterium]|nr:outer membrane beta-barrel protein [Alphaproteobacteria bacterium]